MSINPVDLQVMIPKTTEVSKIQAEENFRPQIEHHNATTTMEQHNQQQLKQVYSKDKAHEAKIDAKKDSQNSSKKKKHKQQQEHQEKEQKQKDLLGTEDKGSQIDIRL